MVRLVESPAQTLLESHARELTGALTAYRLDDGTELRVYLMTGDILAAHSQDDVYHLLRRLVARGALSQPRADALEDQLSSEEHRDIAETTTQLVDHLFEEVEDELLLEVLFDRFKENIAQFLVAQGPPQFEPMEAIFVPNLQIGHDTPALLEELRATVERSGALLEARIQAQSLTPGSRPARQPAEETLLRVLGERLALADLLHRSPYEPFDTLELVVDMLAGGLVVAEGEPPVQEPEELGVDALSADEPTSEVPEDIEPDAPPVDALPVEPAPDTPDTPDLLETTELPALVLAEGVLGYFERCG